jgi:hypothetical protein
MNPVTLPYALLLLGTEFAAGSQLWLLAVIMRGQVTAGFLKMSAGLSAAGTLIAVLIALGIPAAANAGDYPLIAAYFNPLRFALLVMLLLSLISAIAVWRAGRALSIWSSGAASVASLAAIAIAAAIVQAPAWSYAGVVASLLAGALALGGVTLAMSLGHWYLVTPRLPEGPLVEMNLAVLAILAAQALLLIIDVAVPARQQLLSLPLAQNPALWLRAGIGLALAGLLVFMAWQSSRLRGMMSATGLLYLATGAVLAGQALACALLFATGIPG